MFSRAINIAEVENCFAKAAAGGTAYSFPVTVLQGCQPWVVSSAPDPMVCKSAPEIADAFMYGYTKVFAAEITKQPMHHTAKEMPAISRSWGMNDCLNTCMPQAEQLPSMRCRASHSPICIQTLCYAFIQSVISC